MICMVNLIFFVFDFVVFGLFKMLDLVLVGKILFCGIDWVVDLKLVVVFLVGEDVLDGIFVWIFVCIGDKIFFFCIFGLVVIVNL